MAGRWSNVTFDYSGATVLVTGGTAGLGQAIAGAYREAGAEVIITGTRGSPGGAAAWLTGQAIAVDGGYTIMG